MKRNDSFDSVSNKHVGLRVAAFILAMVIAAGAFGYGVVRMGHKDPGYYEIEAAPDPDASFYALGIQLMYYFEGESDQIKAELNTLKDLYSASLLRSYKLLDSENTYDGFVTLADLNQNPGIPQVVSGELYAILSNAWEKTCQGRGYSVVAGSYYREWNSILTLDDISEFDPGENEEMAERLAALAQRLEAGEVSLEFDRAASSVTLRLSDGFRGFLEAGEYSTAVLDTNVLTDAYRLELVRNALAEQGFTNGYLVSASGLTLNLADHTNGQFVLYGQTPEGPAPVATLAAGGNTACSFLRSFSMTQGETMYHGEKYHPNFLVPAAFEGTVDSSCLVDEGGNLVDCCYENLCLFQGGVPDAAPRGMRLACTEKGQPGLVYSNALEGLSALEGVEVRPLP